MKFFNNLICMAAAGIAGYFAEPSLRFQLTGEVPSAAQMARNKGILIQAPGDAPAIALNTLTPEQLPQRILLNTDVKMTDSASGIMMILQAGNRVKLLRIEGGDAVVSPGDGPFLGKVPVTDTDLLQQLVVSPSGSINAAPRPIEETSGQTAASPQSAPAPVSTPEPAVTPEPTPPPEPAATSPAESAPTTEIASSDTVKIMQASIQAGQIKEFTFDQVVDWKQNPDEAADGEFYQIGLISYKAETIFGVKTILAKALIKGGKVQRWIWPKSGMEIK